MDSVLFILPKQTSQQLLYEPWKKKKKTNFWKNASLAYILVFQSHWMSEICWNKWKIIADFAPEETETN